MINVSERKPLKPIACLKMEKKLKDGKLDWNEKNHVRRMLDYRNKYIQKAEPGQVWMVQQRDNPGEWVKGETDKTRPMIIIGRHGNSVNCVPLTSSQTSKNYCRVWHDMPDGGVALIEQIKMVPIQMLWYYMRTESDLVLKEVKKKVVSIFTDPDANYSEAVSMKKDKNQNDISMPNINFSLTIGHRYIPSDVVKSIMNDWGECKISDMINKYKDYNFTKVDFYNIVNEVYGRI